MSAAAVQEVSTDPNGNFEITRLFPGRYHVVARKEEEGYGSNSTDLYNSHPSPLVSLTDVISDASVLVVLGPKAAFLTGTIVEEATGEPVGASIVLWRIKEPDKLIGMSVGSEFHVLIPSGADVGVKLISNGHEDWFIESGSLHMESGASKSIAVKLRKTY